jgi:hypothetical protein
MQDGLRSNGVDEGSLDWNSVQVVGKALLMMGVTILLFLRIAMKKTGPLLSLERRPCYGIKDWDILERRAFEHYMVKVWLKVCLITH